MGVLAHLLHSPGALGREPQNAFWLKVQRSRVWRAWPKLQNSWSVCGVGDKRFRPQDSIWEFPKIGVPYFGVLIMRILLFRVLY